MSSIREIARLANVSPATVSRVINGTANVDAEKAERVARAIAETGFVPNEVARSLFKKSAKMIGLILPSIENPFFTQLASAIDQTAAKHGYRIFLYNTENDPDKERAAFQMLRAMNADGIILTSCGEALRHQISESTIPVVMTDRLFSMDGMDAYVCCDNYQGGRLAAQHLAECGCRKMVCIRGPQELSSARSRYEGYRDFCREWGIPQRTIDCDFNFESGLAAAEELLARYPDVDGIIACNDMVAISAYKVLHRRNISVPDQVQLIGFDDIQLSSLLSPELTTIAQPIQEIGAKAAELIIHNQDTPKASKFVFPATLVVRETTKGKDTE